MAERYAVDVKGLVVKFGDFVAVNRISFRVEPGEIFGFLGANGAGKTTTIRVLCGLLVPTSGSAALGGVDVSRYPLEVKRRVGYMSQRFTLYDDLSVEENLSFTSSLRKMDRALYRRRRDELLGFIAFDRALSTLVKDLPGGIKQQVSLVSSMLHDPEVVFLDEPTAGVTPAARARFWALIRGLAGRGKTVFVTTHYMDEAEQCRRIALMREGRIVGIDSPQGLKDSAFPQHMLELDPIRPLSYREIEALREERAFDFVEPYGLRFHVAIGDPRRWSEVEPRFRERFRIRVIEPSLEDVFIRLVEVKAA